MTVVVGVLSDTHGLLRPAVVAALAGCQLILHAGDVGASDVLTALERIAPTRAVRGNVDGGDWAHVLPWKDVVEVEGHRILVLHNRADLAEEPPPSDVSVVVFGHSHQPYREREGEFLFLNPGSAGPRRFHLPVSVARMRIGPVGVDAEIRILNV